MPQTQELSAEILAQILLIESMVAHLPDEGAIFAFVCRGLDMVPGVKAVRYLAKQGDVGQDNARFSHLQLKIDGSEYGQLQFEISDSGNFQTYRPYLENLCHMLAVVIDQRHQRNAVKLYQQELEQKVEQRTQQLLSEVNDRQSAEAAAVAQQRRAERYLEVAEAIIIELDSQGYITEINKLGCNILGYSEQELTGRDWFEIAPFEAVQQEAREVFLEMISGDIDPVDYSENEIVNRDGNKRTIAWHNVSIFNENDQCTSILSSGKDITERKDAEREAHSLAFYDVLTGLPNRRLMLDRLEQSVANSARNNSFQALLFLDLDNFKELNDTLGHDQGDSMLIETAQRIQQCLREIDTVSRHGGDEFVVLLGQLADDVNEAVSNCGYVADKIIQRLRLPYQLNNQSYQSSVSIGITLIHDHNVSTQELFKRADIAMYQAKGAGKNAYQFFDSDMQARTDKRRSLEIDLRKAINNHEFQLYYQPQVNIHGECVGAEALIRWISEERGFVSPMDFIPFAEDTHLILPIGEWVLEEACEQLQLWQQSPSTSCLTLAVNVSALQFSQRSFTKKVLDIVSRSGVDPTRLKLEITESMLVHDLDIVTDKMMQLKKTGISFALDDFGTGYSSLAYVKRLPLDQLKIDQSFVRDILIDPNDAAICRAIIALGQSLGLHTIAEGVEEPEQWEVLKKEGCKAAQGYLYARPMTAEDFSEWFEKYVKDSQQHAALVVLEADVRYIDPDVADPDAKFPCIFRPTLTVEGRKEP